MELSYTHIANISEIPLSCGMWINLDHRIVFCTSKRESLSLQVRRAASTEAFGCCAYRGSGER